MPLRDHFHPPIEHRLPWPSLHSGWLGELTGRLNELMPPGFLALDTLRIRGGLEIDIATVEGNEPDPSVGGPDAGPPVATARTTYTPPAPAGSCTYRFPDVAEIKVYSGEDTRILVGAIELVSPGNKDRDEAREQFVGKCLDYLGSGASLVIVDVVTERRANLHNLIARRVGAPATVELPEDTHLYATAYRPLTRKKRTTIDFWVAPCTVGDPLPTMPLRLIADYFVPVELEATYTEACRRRRLI